MSGRNRRGKSHSKKTEYAEWQWDAAVRRWFIWQTNPYGREEKIYYEEPQASTTTYGQTEPVQPVETNTSQQGIVSIWAGEVLNT
jgi:hypothetical protein